MRRFLALILLACASLALGQQSYLGVYLGDAKLGYVAYSQKQEAYKGKPALRSDSVNVINAKMLGQGMSMKISSTSWSTLQNQPIRMRFLVESAGRTQLTDAVFQGRKIVVTSDNSGKREKKTLTVPKDGEFTEDPMLALLEGGAVKGAKRVAYVLDPMMVNLVKTTAILRGKARVEVKGKSFDATLIELNDPRAPLKMYVRAKGDLIKAEGPFGIAMIPESKEEAMGESTASYQPSIDLAISTSIKPDKEIGQNEDLKRLVMRVSGQDLSRLPSDGHQTVKRQGASWVVDVHPIIHGSSVSIAKAAALQPNWIRPSTHIASDQADVRALSAKLTRGKSNVLSAAMAIHSHVQGTMNPNPGIGVLRNAGEILKTKEGVCRDYAILTAALMRASKIPTRLASGLVHMGGLFYYHAWVEVFDGKRWIGIDSTLPFKQITPAHVKLAQGNVEDAFVFTIFDKVKLEVLSIERR